MMKKALVLIIVLCTIGQVWAQESQEINYNDPAQVNDLSSNDLASAIQQGKINDMSIVETDNLASALASNPSASSNLENKDLTRALNEDPSLMNNDEVFREVDTRAQTDNSLLNGNAPIKEKWFDHFGITDQGTGIGSYDGTQAVLVGTQGEKGAVITNINDEGLLGAIATAKGEIILVKSELIPNNQAKFSDGAQISSNPDGSFSVQGGHTDLTNSQFAVVQVTGGTISYGNSVYASSTTMPIDVTIKASSVLLSIFETKEDYSITVSGEEVVQMDSSTGKTSVTFTGTLKTYPDGHHDLDQGKYVFYRNGEKSKSIKVTSLSEYRTSGSRTIKPFVGNDGSIRYGYISSYIEEIGGSMKVIARDNNRIEIRTFDNSLKNLWVDQIKDDSSLTFNDNGKVEFTFTKDPPTVKGNSADLTLDWIQTRIINPQGKPQQYRISGGKHHISTKEKGESLGEEKPKELNPTKDTNLILSIGARPVKIILPGPEEPAIKPYLKIGDVEIEPGSQFAFEDGDVLSDKESRTFAFTTEGKIYERIILGEDELRKVTWIDISRKDLLAARTDVDGDNVKTLITGTQSLPWETYVYFNLHYPIEPTAGINLRQPSKPPTIGEPLITPELRINNRLIRPDQEFTFEDRDRWSGKEKRTFRFTEDGKLQEHLIVKMGSSSREQWMDISEYELLAARTDIGGDNVASLTIGSGNPISITQSASIDLRQPPEARTLPPIIYTKYPIGHLEEYGIIHGERQAGNRIVYVDLGGDPRGISRDGGNTVEKLPKNALLHANQVLWADLKGTLEEEVKKAVAEYSAGRTYWEEHRRKYGEKTREEPAPTPEQQPAPPTLEPTPDPPAPRREGPVTQIRPSSTDLQPGNTVVVEVPSYPDDEPGDTTARSLSHAVSYYNTNLGPYPQSAIRSTGSAPSSAPIYSYTTIQTPPEDVEIINASDPNYPSDFVEVTYGETGN